MTIKKSAPSTNNNKQTTITTNNNNNEDDGNIMTEIDQCRSNGFTVDKQINDETDINSRRSVILYCAHRHDGYGCTGRMHFKKPKNKWVLEETKKHRKS